MRVQKYTVFHDYEGRLLLGLREYKFYTKTLSFDRESYAKIKPATAGFLLPAPYLPRTMTPPVSGRINHVPRSADHRAETPPRYLMFPDDIKNSSWSFSGPPDN